MPELRAFLSAFAGVAACVALAACQDDPAAPLAAVEIPLGRPFYDPNASPAPALPAGSPSAGSAVSEPAAAPPTEGPKAAASDDPLAAFGWTRDKDGYIQISYMDLALEGFDQELLVEKLLYPEDYADTDIDWPARIRALDGQKVALTGYMLPLLWKDTSVPHFMLVRDLMACCFGGTPKPDEWTDVKMQGEGSGYYAFVPVITRGIFRLTGLADEAGYAAGAYTIEGHDVRREL